MYIATERPSFREVVEDQTDYDLYFIALSGKAKDFVKAWAYFYIPQTT